MRMGIYKNLIIEELNKSQVITEFGSSRDAEKLGIVIENMKTLIPKVHR